MKIQTLPLLASLTLGLVASATAEIKGPPGIADLPILKPVNPQTAADLCRYLGRQDPGNVFYSPYSISEAMGMAYVGARGRTAAEFEKALGFGKEQSTYASRMATVRVVLHGLLNNKDNRFNVANALCVTGLTPLESYLKTVRAEFGGEVFHGGLEEINDWVSKKTEGNIEKILEELNANSACVLLNAVYFKGAWKDSFDPKLTREQDFFVTSESPVKVKMMSREGTYAVVKRDGWTAVELPYETSASMVLIMPDKPDDMKVAGSQFGSAQSISKLSGELAAARTRPSKINLKFPKFKISTEYDLIPAMKAFGMGDAFNADKADFTAMYDRDDISIAQIKHKATLEVDEFGSVATAATAVEILERSARRVEEIRFDRPFLVMIRENHTETTLFMGRISDPTAEIADENKGEVAPHPEIHGPTIEAPGKSEANPQVQVEISEAQLTKPETEAIPQHYLKEKAVCMKLEGRVIDDHGGYTAEIRLINPTAEPVIFKGYSEKQPCYRIQTLKEGEWQEVEVDKFSSTGLKACTIPPGKSSVIFFATRNDLIPVRFGVSYSVKPGGAEDDIIWSNKIDK